jgi:hypothetical protein
MADRDATKSTQPHKARSSQATTVEQTKERSKALNQKLDVALLPLLSLLYLFNGLDRGNVGNAETQGIKSFQCFILSTYILTN